MSPIPFGKETLESLYAHVIEEDPKYFNALCQVASGMQESGGTGPPPSLYVDWGG